MDKQEFLNKLSEYEGEGCVKVITNNGNEYELEDGSNVVGGFEGTYMSMTLGNVYYGSLLVIGKALWEFLVDECDEVIEEIEI